MKTLKFTFRACTLCLFVIMMNTNSIKAQYCIPPDSAGNFGGPFPYTGITNVSMGILDNTTAFGDDYTYYSSVPAPDLARSSSYTLSLTYEDKQMIGGVGIAIRAWIDWNADIDFDDAGELVASYTIFGTTTGTMDTSVTIPGTANIGITRMRIYTDMTANGGHIFPNPCGYLATPYPAGHPLGQHGVVEDYNLNITAASGIDNIEGDRYLNIYPNPTYGTFAVSISDERNERLEISIQDITGQHIFSDSEKISSNNYNRNFDISSYPKGMYFIQVGYGSQITNHKIVVQ